MNLKTVRKSRPVQWVVGLMKRLSPKTYHALEAITYRRRGEEELALLPLLGARGGTAIDVGANQGFYSYWICKHFNELSVFEPNPLLANRLSTVLPSSVRVFDCALSDRKGVATLKVPSREDGSLNELGSLEVHRFDADEPMLQFEVLTSRLDDLEIGALDFMKIDVEGHEGAVLLGAQATLARLRPDLLIEAEERHRQGAVDAVRAALSPLGYSGWYFHEGRLFPIAGFQATVHQNLAHLNVRSGPKKYINNFLFVARPSSIQKLSSVLER